jgi:hypothetical protein
MRVEAAEGCNIHRLVTSKGGSLAARAILAITNDFHSQGRAAASLPMVRWIRPTMKLEVSSAIEETLRLN